MYNALLLRSKYISFIKRSASLFSIFGILFIPFPFSVLPSQQLVTSFLFDAIIVFLKPYFFDTIRYKEISSDSSSMYMLVIILIALSLLLSLIIESIHLPKKYYTPLFYYKHLLIAYYLSLQLLNYGFDKVFRGQFYLPEPNTLYTPVGFLDKDILFWTTMGVSYEYSIFLGIIQIISGIFLLFRSTRLLGFLSAILIFINIVAINLSFDISVKLYAFFLLFLAIIGCSYYLQPIKRFIFQLQSYVSKISIIKAHPFTYLFLKAFFILLILFETLYPNITSPKIQAQENPLEFLYGGYEVISILKNGDTKQKKNIKRIFIHRQNYIIFQDMEDTMSDYALEVHPIKKEFILKDYTSSSQTIRYNYSEKDRILELNYSKENILYRVTAKLLSNDQLPLLKNNFHWTIDEIK